MAKKFKIGLALGGGGARGLAHVGIIQELENSGIPIDFIAGTSVGSVVGVYYALYQDSKQLKATALQIAQQLSQISNQFDFSQLQQKDRKTLPWGRLTEFIKKGYYLHSELRKICLNDGRVLKNLLDKFLKDYQFSDTKIPFYAVTADLISGKEVVLKDGPLVKAILASCAIPGIFPPIEYPDQLLIDGGIVNNVPVDIVKNMGADFVIACNLNRELKRKTTFKNAIDILFRSEEITSKKLRKIQLQNADFIIAPEIHHIDWWNFRKPEHCILLGAEATRKMVPYLQKVLQSRMRSASIRRFLFKY